MVKIGFANMKSRLKNFLLKSTSWKPVHMGPWIRTLYFKYYLNAFVKDKDSIKTILDAGCGHGHYTNKLALHFPSAKVEGFDILTAPEWQSYKRDNLSFRQQDIMTFNEELKYDLAVCIDTLEHVENNTQAIGALVKSLKKNGIIYIAIPCDSQESYFFPKKYFQSFEEWEKDEHIGVQHTLKDLVTIFEGLRTKVLLKRYTFTFFGHLAWELEYILRGSKLKNRISVFLMPLYKLLGILDLMIPLGKGNNLLVARKI
jgi:SAM-dependent methyltransferase